MRSSPTPPAPGANAKERVQLDIFVICLMGLIAVMILSVVSIMVLTLSGGLLATSEAWPRFQPAIDVFKQVLLMALACVIGMLGGKAAAR
ncbi:hypothetical protein [Caulobacter soli]|uniref:hypothetical protein n=1 Tax=Caulobacter soli TaxID=2708539 RepID=UPI0013EA0BF9|nr:hypothetical protein [Caulobacter soli]